MVAELVRFHDSPSYAAGSTATGRASHTGQMAGEKPKKQPNGPPGLLGVGHRTDNPKS
jgi:hypothetical protein